MLELKDLLRNIQFLGKKVWLISDTHFGHLKCYTEFEPKRLAFAHTFEAFEDKLINNWNQYIGKDDIVLHLGDFCINKHNEDVTINNIKKFTKKLNGIKVLFKGNHDKLDNSVYLDCGWTFVFDKPFIFTNEILKNVTTEKSFCGSLVLDIRDKRILFSHFNILFNTPEFERKYVNEFELLLNIYKKTSCSLNIHGHAHSKVQNSDMNINVSVENIDFKPILLNDMFTEF